ncbi:MAG: tetratricopeptide repeat protein, partial [Rhizomicrobium sp.]
CWARAITNRELPQALDECRQSLQIRPSSTFALDSLGFVQFRMGDLTAALASYDTAIASNAKNSSSLFMRGIVKVRLGRKSEGDADIAAAMALDSAVGDTYRRRGISP